MNHKAIGIIPARGGSKRIKDKNLVELCGKPLIVHSILSAKKSKYLNGSVYVSTEDKNIACISQKYGARIIQRPINLAGDNSTTLSVLQHAVRKLEDEGLGFDTVVLLQATCPFRRVSTINNGIRKHWANWEKLDAVFSVKQSKFPPNWLLRIVNEKLEFILPNDFSKIRGQDLEKTYEFDGVLYVLKKDLINNVKFYPFSHDKTSYLITGKIESIDIDIMEDLEIARALFKYL